MKLQELGTIVSFGTAAFLFGGFARTPANAGTAKAVNKVHHANQTKRTAGKRADVKRFTAHKVASANDAHVVPPAAK